jgi:hypothetical protein
MRAGKVVDKRISDIVHNQSVTLVGVFQLKLDVFIRGKDN